MCLPIHRLSTSPYHERVTVQGDQVTVTCEALTHVALLMARLTIGAPNEIFVRNGQDRPGTMN